MKELAKQSEIGNEQTQLKNIAERFGANTENFSAAQADEKLAERLEIAASPEYSATEKLDKKTLALKKEINEALAERFNTSPEFEELRSKNKLNHLTTLEKARYAYLSYQYQERAKISPAEQRRTNLAYEYAKRNNIDFQIVDALRFYKKEYDNAQIRGDSLSPRESDLYDNLQSVYAAKVMERTEETISRVEDLLYR